MSDILLQRRTNKIQAGTELATEIENPVKRRYSEQGREKGIDLRTGLVALRAKGQAKPRQAVTLKATESWPLAISTPFPGP